ncbi:MAG: 4Fe-4S binding protein [Candidatus Methanofastidiosia archaeon]
MIRILKGYCKGCLLCIEYCPKNVLAKSDELNYHFHPKVVDLESCTKCRICELRCPDFAISVI